MQQRIVSYREWYFTKGYEFDTSDSVDLGKHYLEFTKATNNAYYKRLIKRR